MLRHLDQSQAAIYNALTMQKHYFFRLKKILTLISFLNHIFMIRLVLLCFLIAPLTVFSKSQFISEKKLVILGDSLTEGYGVTKESAFPALLEEKIKKDQLNWVVVNSGISGSTTASSLTRIPWILKSKPHAVIIALGANDGLRGLKVEDTKKNLEKAIQELQSKNVLVILAGMQMPPNYGKEFRSNFAKIFPDLSKKYKITLIPFLLESVAGNPKFNLADGIHPNEEGHKIIANTVYKYLKPILEK